LILRTKKNFIVENQVEMHMNTVTLSEMKVEMFELLAQTHDEAKVIKLYEAIHDVLDPDSDGWSDLPAHQQQILDMAIEETYNPANLVPHEQVLKMIDKWLKE
jgi:hypothetical protein